MKRKFLDFARIVSVLLIIVVSNLLPISQLHAQDNDPARMVETGYYLLFQSDFAGAETAYNDAITSDPSYAPAYAHRCYLRTFQNRIEEAVADCQKAVTLNPGDAEGYIYLTRAFD